MAGIEPATNGFHPVAITTKFPMVQRRRAFRYIPTGPFFDAPRSDRVDRHKATGASSGQSSPPTRPRTLRRVMLPIQPKPELLQPQRHSRDSSPPHPTDPACDRPAQVTGGPFSHPKMGLPTLIPMISFRTYRERPRRNSVTPILVRMRFPVGGRVMRVGRDEAPPRCPLISIRALAFHAYALGWQIGSGARART